MRHGTRTYLIGFILSLSITFCAYAIVSNKLLPSGYLNLAILLAALTQLVIQLFYFLHLGKEGSPRWNQMLFGLMGIMVFILVFGTIWIMQNLDYTHASSEAHQEEQEIILDEGIQP